MKLFEFMAKELFARNGIPIPQGRVVRVPSEAAAACQTIGSVVLKSQILSGGRGKAGGIKFADTPDEAATAAGEILGTELKGFTVDTLLVEQKLQIDQELYLAITIDKAAQCPVLIASAFGGMDIEDLAEDKLVKHNIDVGIGIMPYLTRELNRKLGLSGVLAQQAAEIFTNLYKVFREYDAELVEINPLVVSGEKLVAADGKVTIDDEAMFRVGELVPHTEERTDLEIKAAELGISYVQLEGDIAVMANGAGITMATLDILQHYGGHPANFMDAGGGAGIEATAKALEILLATQPKAILVNIFGGITRCDDVATAFAQVKQSRGIDVPLVIRLVGTNQAEGVRILQENGIDSFRTIKEAVEKVVQIANA
ncbi:MAG: ADP-forming succinate--CoA ligase subunit beta [Peptococcaceae bacterium]|nr:ADP-forming succinate--CoA ligase subunit beta [Peptococcaceae bacterium]